VRESIPFRREKSPPTVHLFCFASRPSLFVVFLIPSSCFGYLVRLNGLPHQCTVVLFVMRGGSQIFSLVPSCGFSIIILCTIVDHAVCWDCLSVLPHVM
jgi:hypothetical protein